MKIKWGPKSGALIWQKKRVLHVRTQEEDVHLQARKKATPGIASASTSILDFPASGAVRNKGMLVKLLSLCYFVIAAQAD